MTDQSTAVRIYTVRGDNLRRRSHELLDCTLRAWADAMQYQGADLRVVRPPLCKPYLEGNSNVHFSVTHSGHWWMCAISQWPVGLDLQQIRQTNSEKIARRFFHEEEKNYLALHPEDFFKVWTAKESVVKLSGQGITDAFGDFSVVQNGILKKETQGNQLCFIPFEDGYEMCLCSGCPYNVTLQLMTLEEKVLPG